MKLVFKLGIILLLIFLFIDFQVESTVPGVFKKRSRGLYFYRLIRPFRSRAYYKALFRYRTLRTKEDTKRYRNFVRHSTKLGKKALKSSKYITKKWTKALKGSEFNHHLNYLTDFDSPQYVPKASPVFELVPTYAPVPVHKPGPTYAPVPVHQPVQFYNQSSTIPTTTAPQMLALYS